MGEHKKYENDLLKQFLQLHNLLENMNELFYTYNDEGIMTFVNKKAVELLGYTPDEVIGRPLWDFVPERYRERFKVAFRLHMEAGRSDSYLLTALHKSGSERILQLKTSPIVESGKIVGEMALAEDITARRVAEKALIKTNRILEEIKQELSASNEQLMATEEELRQQLEESEKNKNALVDAHQQLEAILDFLPDPTFAVDIDGRVTIWNRAMEELTGIKSREILGRGKYVYAIPFYGKRCPMLLDLILDETVHPEFKYNFIKRKNETFFVEKFCPQLRFEGAHLSCKAAPLYDNKKCLIGAIETIRDISERKHAEKALLESEAKYRNIIQSIEDGYFEVDLKGNFTFFNRGLVEKVGYSANEFMGKSYTLVMDDENAQKVKRTFNMVFNSRKAVKDFSWCVQKKDGTSLYVESTVLPIFEEEKMVGFRGIIRDITDRKRAENALLVSERNLQKQVNYLNMLINNLNELFFTYDIEGKMTFINKRSLEVIGYLPEEMWGRHVSDFVDEKHRSRVLKEVEGRINEGKAGTYELPIIHKNGQERVIRLNASPIIEGDGSITGGMVLAEDITETKQAQEALKFSEARYRAIVEDQTELIVRFSPEGRLTFVNEAFSRYYNRTRGQFVKTHFIDQVFEEDQAWVDKNIKLLNIIKPVCVVEHRVKMPDGELRWQQWTHRAIFDETGKLLDYQSVGRDVTERKRAEEELRYLGRHDSLTGLYNRFHFEEQMQRVEDGNADPVGLIMCDVDGLKLVNDTLGHSKGDALLKAVANIIKSCFRKEDTVARVGGDEFAVLLPCSGKEAVEKAVKRLRQNIQVHNEKNPHLPISISLGWAIRNDLNITMGELFREADNNMYREKLHSGQSARSSIVQALLKALETRDYITEGHGERLQELVVTMARSLDFPEQSINELRLLAQFHDIGKVGVPDSILFKKGPLTNEEYSVMKRHSEIGHRMALVVPELILIADWILKHHEWWNGNGYPLGLKGQDIPLECRILSIADAYDSMTHDRPYRKAMTHAEAVDELKRCSGTQFDPDLVEEFIKVLDDLN